MLARGEQAPAPPRRSATNVWGTRLAYSPFVTQVLMVTPRKYFCLVFASLLVFGAHATLDHARAEPATVRASIKATPPTASPAPPQLTLEQLLDLVLDPRKLSMLDADDLQVLLPVGDYRTIPNGADASELQRVEGGKGLVRRLAASFERGESEERSLRGLDVYVAHDNARALYTQVVHAAQRRHGKLVWLADTQPIARSAWCMSEEQGWVVLVARVGGELLLRATRNETCSPQL
jgi:hypothetical protein